MTAVFSWWYIVMIALVVVTIALIGVFVAMDKKDKVLISNFVKEAKKSVEKPTETNKEEDIKKE